VCVKRASARQAILVRATPAGRGTQGKFTEVNDGARVKA
jgi:hypothetical protein